MRDLIDEAAARWPRAWYWLVEGPAGITRVWQRIYTAILLVMVVSLWISIAVLLIALAVTA